MNSSSRQTFPVMVVILLPEDWSPSFVEAIPAQRLLLNKLLAKGVVQSYSVSADRTKVWMVLNVEDDQFEVDAVLSKFPIFEFVEYSWEPLLFSNDSSSVMHFSLN